MGLKKLKIILPNTCSCLLDNGGAEEGRKQEACFLFTKCKDPLRSAQMLLYYIWLHLECQTLHKTPRHPPHSLQWNPSPVRLRGSVHPNWENIQPFSSREGKYLLQKGKILPVGHYSFLSH